MAKKAMIMKEERKIDKSTRYLAHRNELRKKSRSLNLSPEEREVAQLQLQKLPRNTSPFRVTRRCKLTGRPKGHLRKFGLSRIAVRDLASRGLLPGVTKASW